MHQRVVKVSFKDPSNKEKKYVAKRACDFFDSLEEATQKLGSIGALSKLNMQVEKEFADGLRIKLKNKVTGKAESADVEDMSDLLADD